MIFHDLIPKEKFKVGNQYRTIGPAATAEIIILNPIARSTNYHFIDNNRDAWTRYGFWCDAEEEEYRLFISSYPTQPIKDFICNNLSRIIPI